jgi:sulfite reductase (NADPH) hemoprotein beta-component
MPVVIKRIIEVYIKERHEDERFIDCVQRIGFDPFKKNVYQVQEV